MSGISSIGSATPTTEQILEAELQMHLLHKHASHPTASLGTQATPSAANDPGSGSVSGIAHPTPTPDELREVVFSAPADVAIPVASQTGPSAGGNQDDEIDVMA
ncbi:MAG TPA: hypothetical protein VHY91_04920 [Pirellulales bacterium]|jgi:hypothetical protein|nr:hypothetical protein [Pirellulales bacterium]